MLRRVAYAYIQNTGSSVVSAAERVRGQYAASSACWENPRRHVENLDKDSRSALPLAAGRDD